MLLLTKRIQATPSINVLLFIEKLNNSHLFGQLLKLLNIILYYTFILYLKLLQKKVYWKGIARSHGRSRAAPAQLTRGTHLLQVNTREIRWAQWTWWYCYLRSCCPCSWGSPGWRTASGNSRISVLLHYLSLVPAVSCTCRLVYLSLCPAGAGRAAARRGRWRHTPVTSPPATRASLFSLWAQRTTTALTPCSSWRCSCLW